MIDSLDSVDGIVCAQSLSQTGFEIKRLDNLILYINHGTALLTGHKHDRGR